MTNKGLVAVPAFNEALNIRAVILDILKNTKKLNCDLLIINDCSTDNTADILKDLGCIFISHDKNLGPGGAFKTALNYAHKNKYDFLATMDGDGQHSAKDLYTLIQNYRNTNSNLVIGSRFLNTTSTIPVSRKFSNHLINLVFKHKHKIDVTDSQSGMRVMGESAYQLLGSVSNGHQYCSDIIYLANLNNLTIEEVPISVKYSSETIKNGQSAISGLRVLARCFKLSKIYPKSE